MTPVHPAVQILKDEIKARGIGYEALGVATGISVNKLRNIMSGRTIMNMLDRDRICECLEMSPVDLVMRRGDLHHHDHFLDLRKLPEGLQTALRIMHAEMLILCSLKNINIINE